jgi:hypothetical protein
MFVEHTWRQNIPSKIGRFNHYTVHKPRRPPPINKNHPGNPTDFLHVLHKNT